MCALRSMQKCFDRGTAERRRSRRPADGLCSCPTAAVDLLAHRRPASAHACSFSIDSVHAPPDLQPSLAAAQILFVSLPLPGAWSNSFILPPYALPIILLGYAFIRQTVAVSSISTLTIPERRFVTTYWSSDDFPPNLSATIHSHLCAASTLPFAKLPPPPAQPRLKILSSLGRYRDRHRRPRTLLSRRDRALRRSAAQPRYLQRRLGLVLRLPHLRHLHHGLQPYAPQRHRLRRSARLPRHARHRRGEARARHPRAIPTAAIARASITQTNTAEPGYYSVLLKDYGIHAELTATERTGLHHYTFPGRTHRCPPHRRSVARLRRHGKTRVDSAELTVTAQTRSPAAAPPTPGATAARSTSPCSSPDARRASSSTRRPGSPAPVSAGTQRQVLKCVLHFDPAQRADPGARPASPASVPQARQESRSRAARTGTSTARSAAAPRSMAAQLSPHPDRRRRTRRTSRHLLHRALSHVARPIALRRRRRRLPRHGQAGPHSSTAGQHNYTTFSLWDTYRAAHPAYTLIERAARAATS